MGAVFVVFWWLQSFKMLRANVRAKFSWLCAQFWYLFNFSIIPLFCCNNFSQFFHIFDNYLRKTFKTEIHHFEVLGGWLLFFVCQKSLHPLDGWWLFLRAKRVLIPWWLPRFYYFSLAPATVSTETVPRDFIQNCTLYSGLCTLNIVKCTIYRVYFTLNNVYFTLNSVQCILYNITFKCTLYFVKYEM